MAKKLIAYYSRRGQNYVNGTVTNLRIGNTEVLAELLSSLIDADLFRIEPATEYAADYYQCIDQAHRDLLKNARPKLKYYPANMEQYENIYLGYPNYWGTMPMFVFSFLEQFDFTGKVIHPFCTHESGGMGRSEQDIRQICPTAEVAPGLSICGANVRLECSSVREWIGNVSFDHRTPNEDANTDFYNMPMNFNAQE